jgi:subtilase family serine protease
VNRRLLFAVIAALSVSVTACGGGGGGGAIPAAHLPGTTNTSTIPSQLLVSNYDQDVMKSSTYVGPIANAHLNVTVLVHQQNAQALVQYAQDVSNPGSALFRHFLTPDQIAERFGATLADYQAAAQYFAKNGLAVAGWRQRMLLTVAGSQSKMEKAFGTTFGIYEHDGQQFVAPDSQPHFSQPLPVDAVGNIVGYRLKHTYIIFPPHAGTGYTTGYSPSTVRAAFDYIGDYNNGGYNGDGVIIAIIGTGPIDTTSSGKGDVDLNAYLAATNTTSAAPVVEKTVTEAGVASGLQDSGINPADFPFSGDFQSPPPVSKPTCAGSLPSCNPEDGEAQLDTQQASTLAPDATVYFYLAYNAADCENIQFPNSCPTTGSNAGQPEIGIAESDPEIQQVISDNEADVVSMSFGEGEFDPSNQGAGAFSGYSSGSNPYSGSYSQLEFAELETEGIAIFASSGDNGSAECTTATTYLAEQCVSYPAGDPAITSVGGITANVNVFGQPTAPWLAWGISTSDSGYGALEGSGGGVSAIIPAPSWQSSVLGASNREQPDVSMIGDPSTGVSLIENAAFGGTIQGIGGTSVAAPEMAAMWADVLSACKVHPGTAACPMNNGGHYWRLGNASPYLYAIYACKSSCTTGQTSQGVNWTPTLPYDQVFYDIIYGDNQMQNPTYTPATPIPGASAGPGYDLVSGIGVPFAGHLTEAITKQPVP